MDRQIDKLKLNILDVALKAWLENETKCPDGWIDEWMNGQIEEWTDEVGDTHIFFSSKHIMRQ